MQIVTNNNPRPLLSYFELSEKQRDWNDYEYAENDRFVVYKGWAYPLSSFTAVPEIMSEKWDGVYSLSYFDGILVKIVEDDSVIVGRFYS